MAETSGFQGTSEDAISRPYAAKRTRIKNISIWLMIIGLAVEAIGAPYLIFIYLPYYIPDHPSLLDGVSVILSFLMFWGTPLFLAGVALWARGLHTGDPRFDATVRWSLSIAALFLLVGALFYILKFLFIYNGSNFSDYILLNIIGGLFSSLGMLAAMIGAFLLVRKAMNAGLNLAAFR
ncbi:MAG: hypothetical protein LUO85_04740 [Methanomassiliicoccales archaeon]|nr:hypothetical protein [Methanomassiliicoccales archaeon]